MIGHLALPTGVDRRPAVLVGPEGPGLNDFQRRRADTLAELGYVALAFDINGGRWFTDPEEMLAHTTPPARRPRPDAGHRPRGARRVVRRTADRPRPDRCRRLRHRGRNRAGTRARRRQPGETGRPGWAAAAPASCSPATATDCACTSSATAGRACGRDRTTGVRGPAR
ncbi:dienelactone hydrolase family protein [Microbispora sp. CA-102843]|uniref:dienelactone hydrolase family protein n=1 Tax=Microbispora sp. CA-102843 TaxID=3239952 RepID=UPI003D8A1022